MYKRQNQFTAEKNYKKTFTSVFLQFNQDITIEIFTELFPEGSQHFAGLQNK